MSGPFKRKKEETFRRAQCVFNEPGAASFVWQESEILLETQRQIIVRLGNNQIRNDF